MSRDVSCLHQRAASLRVPTPTLDGQNSLHAKMLIGSVYRVGCSGAFAWKSQYRTCGAGGVTKRFSGRRRDQLLRNVARQSGGHHPGHRVHVQGMADRELQSRNRRVAVLLRPLPQHDEKRAIHRDHYERRGGDDRQHDAMEKRIGARLRNGHGY
jgi:hypothetical protein